MGPLIGTIGGLGTWLSLKTAFALIGMGAYINLFFPNLPILPVAVAFAICFGLLNLTGSKSAGIMQLILVGGLLMILAWFMTGILHIQPNRFSGFFDKGTGSILATAGLVYISYVGLTKVASISEEVRNPERNLPLGVFLSLGTAIVVYVVGTTVMVGVIPMDQLAGNLAPVATAAELLAGTTGKILIVVAALCAFSSVANAGILSASRYPLAMSRDRMVPEAFARLARRGIPINGVLVTVVLILIILIVFDPLKIAKLASSFQLLLFAMNCLAVIVMRESRIESYDPGYTSPWYPWMQIAGIFTPFWLMALMGWMPVLFTLGMVSSGIIWYYWYARANVERGGAIFHVFELLGRQRFEGLDTELRGIMKEKGLRKEDPFNEVVARSHAIEAVEGENFESVASRASTLLAERVPAGADHILEGFLRGTRIGMTPVAHGAALPHLRIADMANAEMLLVRARCGMNIEAANEFGDELQLHRDIHAIFFLVSPEDNPGQHLRILAQVAERVDDDGFKAEWTGAEDEQQLKETLLRNDHYLSLHLSVNSKAAPLIGRTLRELQIPEGCLIALIRRGDFTFVPRAGTVIGEGDRLTIIG